MMIYLSLLIPIIGAIIVWWWFQHRITLWEFLLPIIASLIFIVSFKAVVKAIQVSSTEYLGNLGVKAQYYEPWSTWVHKTCSRTVGSGKNQRTEYYDCSYCDDNSEEYYLVDDGGNKFSISEQSYNYFTKLWSAKPQFVELNRDINTNWRCGKDGDLYEVFWDNQILTSVPTTREHSYENKVKCAPSAFNYPKIDENDKKVYGLFDYSDVNGFSQKTILGDNEFSWMSQAEKDTAEIYAKFLSGYFGPKKQLKLWVLLFKDKPSLAASMQEAYWVNGNKNEVVVCIGLNSRNRSIDWVRCFSWSQNRTMLVDIREDIMNLETYNFKFIYPILHKNLQEFKRREFKEFDYITVETPAWATITTYIIVAIITILICYWSVNNEFHQKPH